MRESGGFMLIDVFCLGKIKDSTSWPDVSILLELSGVSENVLFLRMSINKRCCLHLDSEGTFVFVCAISLNKIAIVYSYSSG